MSPALLCNSSVADMFVVCVNFHWVCCSAYLLHPSPGLGDTANFGIAPIPSNYRASIADTDTA